VVFQNQKETKRELGLCMPIR